MFSFLVLLFLQSIFPFNGDKDKFKIYTAVLSALLAVEHKSVTSQEGIIAEDVDASIRNLTVIGRDGMTETDRLILDIMLKK